MKKRFSEQVHLDDVPELRAEYKKKLSSIELQLSGMVQVKVRLAGRQAGRQAGRHAARSSALLCCEVLHTTPSLRPPFSHPPSPDLTLLVAHAQLDGVKRAMDVIQAANNQMAAVRGEFEGMHELCRKAGEQGKVLFDPYPRLKMVNRARKNLERTLKEVRRSCCVAHIGSVLFMHGILFLSRSSRR